MYKIDKLLKQKQSLFHTRDLALLWEISNNNTLYTTIKRYLKKGVLIPIYKGFYSTISLDKIDPLTLGFSYLHRFSYLSCETILIKEGVIFQKESYLTFVSNLSKKFTIANYSFLVRKLKEEFLFNPFGIEKKENIFVATLERAVADLLYLNPYFHFDNKKIIKWNGVKKIQKEVGYL